MALARQVDSPFREHAGEGARFFVIARHLHGCVGTLERCLKLIFVAATGLLLRGSGPGRSWFCQDGEPVLGFRQAAKSGGAEEDDGVLNFFPAKTRERL